MKFSCTVAKLSRKMDLILMSISNFMSRLTKVKKMSGSDENHDQCFGRTPLPLKVNSFQNKCIVVE